VNCFPIHGLKEFLLVVSVGHCKYRVSETSIGFIFRATLGGSAVNSRVSPTRDPSSSSGFI
jgi:hypothetical protein